MAHSPARQAGPGPGRRHAVGRSRPHLRGPRGLLVPPRPRPGRPRAGRPGGHLGRACGPEPSRHRPGSRESGGDAARRSLEQITPRPGGRRGLPTPRPRGRGHVTATRRPRGRDCDHRGGPLLVQRGHAPPPGRQARRPSPPRARRSLRRLGAQRQRGRRDRGLQLLGRLAPIPSRRGACRASGRAGGRPREAGDVYKFAITTSGGEVLAEGGPVRPLHRDARRAPGRSSGTSPTSGTTRTGCAHEASAWPSSAPMAVYEVHAGQLAPRRTRPVSSATTGWPSP